MNGSVTLYMVTFLCSYATANTELIYASNEPWDLDAPCQPYIEDFANASSRMVQCAAAYSSPPKVCTYCTEQYIALKQIEYKLRKLENVSSYDNTTCNRVIFENYLISYVSEISATITKNIWEESRCSSCVNITWHLETNSSGYIFSNNTISFQNKLYNWRHCVANFSFPRADEAAICNKCLSSFNELFQFYWYIYTTPHVNFCLDVETTMNDTMNVWHNVWHCPDDRIEELRDWTLLGYSLVLLITITLFFYADSRLEAPRGLRSHILSSSTLERVSTSTTRDTEQFAN